MENRKEGNWMSVPTFGDWDMKNGTMPDYSMDFTKIREMRKQNKTEISRASIGNGEELASNPRQGGGAHRGNDDNLHHRHVNSRGSDEMDHRRPLHHVGDHSPTLWSCGFSTEELISISSPTVLTGSLQLFDEQ